MSRHRSPADRHAARFELEGWFRVEVVKKRSGLITRTLEFRNLIVDAGLEGLAGGTSIQAATTWLGVGTGTTPPANTDTSLGAQLGARANTNGGFADVYSEGPSETYAEILITREMEFTGDVNLTELGFFSAAAAGFMWNRQLFKDDLGNPTTVTVLDDEKLRVKYTYRVWYQQVAAVQSITIDGVSTSVETRCYNLAGKAYNAQGMIVGLGIAFSDDRLFACSDVNVMPALTATVGGTIEAATSVTILPYVGASFQRDLDILFDTDKGNYTPEGLGAVLSWPYGPSFLNQAAGIIHTFDPKVLKNDTKRFTWRSRMTYARYIP